MENTIGRFVFLSDEDGKLVKWDWETFAVVFEADTGVEFTDIAIAPDGTLFGITFTGLYEIDGETGEATFIADHDLTDANALFIDPFGRAFIASDVSDELRRINLETGETALFTDLDGRESAGDIALHDGVLWMLTKDQTLLAVDPFSGAILAEQAHDIDGAFALTSGPDGFYLFAGNTAYALTMSGLSLIAVTEAFTVDAAGDIFGAAGSDYGQDGDALRNLDGAPRIDGSSRDDVIIGFDENDRLFGRNGDDWIEGGEGFNRLDGGAGDDVLNNGDGGGVLLGQGGDDLLFGGAGRDIIRGGEGDDLVSDFAGDNVLDGGAGNDVLYGGAGDELLLGRDGADLLIGSAGNDNLKGQAGDDEIIGGTGRDFLNGAEGADLFVFESVEDSTPDPAGRDTILGFARGGGDLMDLSAIDADVGTPEDDAFVIVDEFTGTAGQLRYELTGTEITWKIQADVDGDGEADFELLVRANTMADDAFIL